MRLILISSILTLAVISSYSQTSVMRNVSDLSDQYTVEKSKGNFMIGYEEVKGSPYLNEDFLEGEILINDSIRYDSIPMRYNMYSDRIEFQNNLGQILEIGISENSYYFNFGNQEFTLSNYSEREKEKRGILEILVEGNIKLYKQYLVDFKEATRAMGYQEAQPNRFVRQDDEFLISIGQNKPELFYNPKELLDKLILVKPDVEQFKKKEKLKLRSEKDLIRLIQYCNN